ncbi:nicolin-1-like isoform X2 [Octopus sinensis]|uniref:Nicolin-1-like isoform X2 n=1 Tax=Octopus sinensis TaxID=2607531 RepID=A0A6P7SFA7_9MOLL|nr:nicolin-1-like isoform X2 [Octopus sinensis]
MAATVQKALACSQQPPVSILVGNDANFITGQKIIPITFPYLVISGIDEIHFQNYYTALLTIKAKFQLANQDSKVWKTCLRKYPLMPAPHCEIGSESNFVIGKKQLICELTNVVELKLILLQPSPVWIDFSLEDIKLFRGSQHSVVQKPVDKEIKDDEEENEVENEDGDECMKYNPFGMDLSAISKTMQKWSLINQPLNSRSKVKQSKYEIDGSYDIKLLSYS